MLIRREDLDKYPIIGSGGQGKIYKIDEETVIKVSVDTNVELLRKMSRASLQQFIMPLEEVYDNDECYTFTYPLLDKEKSESALLLPKEMMVKNIDVLIEDVRKISSKRIIISDVIPINSFCIEKTIYMFDYDLYRFAPETLSEEEIFKKNLSQLEKYFQKLWIRGLVEVGIDIYTLRHHPEYICRNCLFKIKEEMNEEESIKEYIKRRVTSGI